MKFYVSAKWELKEKVREINEKIRERGHEITEDWTTRAFERNYAKFDRSAEFSEREVNLILDSDILVHLSDGGGKGKYVDLGIALAGNKLQRKPLMIYVIGEETNQSQFYFHPFVKRRRTIEEVLDEIENK